MIFVAMLLNRVLVMALVVKSELNTNYTLLLIESIRQALLRLLIVRLHCILVENWI